jgi:hypothetical protein
MVLLIQIVIRFVLGYCPRPTNVEPAFYRIPFVEKLVMHLQAAMLIHLFA